VGKCSQSTLLGYVPFGDAGLPDRIDAVHVTQNSAAIHYVPFGDDHARAGGRRPGVVFSEERPIFQPSIASQFQIEIRKSFPQFIDRIL
jgi:hypothetical protein